MGIYIKNMEMPTKGYRLILIHADGTVQNTGGETTAISVPPHGRLIDADSLTEFIDNRFDITWKNNYEDCIKDACCDILEEIEKLPTVIPADESNIDSFIRIFEEDNEEDEMDSFIRILKD